MRRGYPTLASAERARAGYRRDERAEEFLTAENGLVAELTQVTGSQRQALRLAGVSRSTWQYRQRPRARTMTPVPHAERAYPSRISAADRQRIEEHILAGWAKEVSVDHSFAAAWDAGVMLGSRRTWWRIAKALEQQALRPTIPTKKGKPEPREAPVVTADRPAQAWSWDITDIYSREIVGYRVEDREADHLAVEMFETTIAQRGAPEVVHADSGPAMRSNAVGTALSSHGTRLSHNRPYVSNDNPFSEAGFRTMKYRPGYPRVFETLDAARTYIADYVAWYNTKHKHSGIALFSPTQVGDGSWKRVWQTRDQALQRYYHQHPQRFRAKPRTPSPAERVGINLPSQNLSTTEPQ